jgi:hypothetical protein
MSSTRSKSKETAKDLFESLVTVACKKRKESDKSSITYFLNNEHDPIVKRLNMTHDDIIVARANRMLLSSLSIFTVAKFLPENIPEYVDAYKSSCLADGLKQDDMDRLFSHAIECKCVKCPMCSLTRMITNNAQLSRSLFYHVLICKDNNCESKSCKTAKNIIKLNILNESI